MELSKHLILIDETDGCILFNAQRNLFFGMDVEEFINSDLYQKYGVGEHKCDYIQDKIKEGRKSEKDIFFSLKVIVPDFFKGKDLAFIGKFKNNRLEGYDLGINELDYAYKHFLIFKEWFSTFLSTEVSVGKEHLFASGELWGARGRIFDRHWDTAVVEICFKRRGNEFL